MILQCTGHVQVKKTNKMTIMVHFLFYFWISLGEVQDSPCEGGTSSIKASTLNVQLATEVQPSNGVHSTNSIHSSLYFVITSITLGLLVL